VPRGAASAETVHMETAPCLGHRTAALLHGLGLPVPVIVRALMEEVGMTHDEAHRAAVMAGGGPSQCYDGINRRNWVAVARRFKAPAREASHGLTPFPRTR
jgi:hypothetical protein